MMTMMVGVILMSKHVNAKNGTNARLLSTVPVMLTIVIILLG